MLIRTLVWDATETDSRREHRDMIGAAKRGGRGGERGGRGGGKGSKSSLGGAGFGVEVEATLLQVLCHPLPALPIKPASMCWIMLDHSLGYSNPLQLLSQPWHSLFERRIRKSNTSQLSSVPCCSTCMQQRLKQGGEDWGREQRWHHYSGVGERRTDGPAANIQHH